MEINDIVLVKKLDYTDVEIFSDEDERKEQEETIKELMNISGTYGRITSKNTVEGHNFITVEGLERKHIMLGGSEHPIALSEDEVDVVESDYLNNCCRDQISSGSIQDNFICKTCGFSIRTLIKKYTS